MASTTGNKISTLRASEVEAALLQQSSAEFCSSGTMGTEPAEVKHCLLGEQNAVKKAEDKVTGAKGPSACRV